MAPVRYTRIQSRRVGGAGGNCIGKGFGKSPPDPLDLVEVNFFPPGRRFFLPRDMARGHTNEMQKACESSTDPPKTR